MNYENILLRKLGELFPDELNRNNAEYILNEYGIENYEYEPYRVRLAVLKLAGTNVDRLIEYIDTAKQDYRDILSWAEYPRQIKCVSLQCDKKKQKLISDDEYEYNEWLSI